MRPERISAAPPASSASHLEFELPLKHCGFRERTGSHKTHSRQESHTVQGTREATAESLAGDVAGSRNPAATSLRQCGVNAAGIKASYSRRCRIAAHHSLSLAGPDKRVNSPSYHYAPRECSVVSQASGCHTQGTRLSHGSAKATQNHLHNRSSCTHKSALAVLLTPDRRGYYAASPVYVRCALAKTTSGRRSHYHLQAPPLPPQQLIAHYENHRCRSPAPANSRN